MATPFRDLEVDFWAWLNADASYTALGLTEYRGYDGKVLPWDPDEGLFPSAALPGIDAIATEMGHRGPDDAFQPVTGQVQEFVRLDVRIVYGTTSGAIARSSAFEAAVAVVLDRLNSATARQSAMGSINIDSYEVEDGNVRSIQGKGEARAKNWIYVFGLLIRGNCRFVS